MIGWVQDKQLLSGIFPFQSWGRRAPWYFTHMFPMAVTVALLCWVPESMKQPSDDDDTIYIYLFVVCFVLRWCSTQCYTAYKAAVMEVFPSSADRVRLEYVASRENENEERSDDSICCVRGSAPRHSLPVLSFVRTN